MLEQLSVSERHRTWVDHVAQLFGGLDICAIELLVGKDGREHIIEVNDSALSLMGDSQEEDRRHIADLVTAKMQVTRATRAITRESRLRSKRYDTNHTIHPDGSPGLLPAPERVDEDSLARLDVGFQPSDQPGGRSHRAANGTLGIARKHRLYGEYRELGLRGFHRDGDDRGRHRLGQSSPITAARLPRFVLLRKPLPRSPSPSLPKRKSSVLISI